MGEQVFTDHLTGACAVPRLIFSNTSNVPRPSTWFFVVSITFKGSHACLRFYPRLFNGTVAIMFLFSVVSFFASFIGSFSHDFLFGGTGGHGISTDHLRVD